jgi:hypothetical protein
LSPLTLTARRVGSKIAVGVSVADECNTKHFGICRFGSGVDAPSPGENKTRIVDRHMNRISNSPLFNEVPADEKVIFSIVIGVITLYYTIKLVAFVFYLLTLQRALSRCAPEHRAMEPGLVWLLLIPCFGFIWNFFVVLNISKSLAAEFQTRNVAVEPQPGRNIGLIMCILGCAIIFFTMVSMIPLIGLLFSLVNLPLCLARLVFWILYWVKIAGYSKQLAT